MPEAGAPRATYAAGGMATFVMFAYACTLALAMLHLPPHRLDGPTSIFLVSIGLLALWRYSWWGLHVIRAIRYRKTVFPGLRQAADAIAPSVRPEHVYVLITSYRVAPETTFEFFRVGLEARTRPYDAHFAFMRWDRDPAIAAIRKPALLLCGAARTASWVRPPRGSSSILRCRDRGSAASSRSAPGTTPPCPCR